MKRLGYTRYRRAGRRLGRASSCDLMGAAGSRPELLGIHTNMAGASRPSIVSASPLGGQRPAPAGSRRRGAARTSSCALLRGSTASGYARDGVAPADAVRPRGLAGRPGGLDARPRRGELRATSSARPSTGAAGRHLTRDDVLDNITLFWLTNTGVSSARLYWENKLSLLRRQGRPVPVGREHLRRTRSTWPRGAGPSRRTPSSSTTTRRPRAGTSRPGSSRRSSPKKSAPASSRCGR